MGAFTIVADVLTSPLNMILMILCLILAYSIRNLKKAKESKILLPTLNKRDFTLNELLEYDGTNEEGRILIAVNGFVFDVSADDRYGKDGPYHSYAGRDASRALARFNAELNSPVCYDDLIDLSTEEMNNLREWERQFRKKFFCVGRLLVPGETHSVYPHDDPDLPLNTSLNKSSYFGDSDVCEESMKKNL